MQRVSHSRDVRRRSRQLLILALALGAGWVATPALSTTPYIPAAVDFEQRLPDVARVDPDRDAFRSGVIAAPERFDLVGLAGELRELELRARETDGEWTDWVETANGDPVYFGGADELELRTHGWRPSGRLHYVNVSGSTSTAESLLTDARQALNGAFISAAAAVEPDADAAPARPAIVKRSTWGATRGKGGCPPRAKPVLGEVKAAAIHHTVTATDYSEAEAPAIVLGICRYHRNGNGWNDIGYNALVDRFGNVYAGRAGGLQKAVVGAHAQGFNAQTSGVAAIGTHTSAPISPAAMEGFVSFLAWKLARHGLSASGTTVLTSAGGEASRYPSGRKVRINRIFGHGRVGLTACPGDSLDAQLGKIRRRTQARMDEDDGSVTPPPEPAPPPPLPPPGGGIIPK